MFLFEINYVDRSWIYLQIVCKIKYFKRLKLHNVVTEKLDMAREKKYILLGYYTGGSVISYQHWGTTCMFHHQGSRFLTPAGGMEAWNHTLTWQNQHRHITSKFINEIKWQTLITLLSNEICPNIKLDDYNVFFHTVIYLKYVLWYHLSLPRNMHI